MKTRPLSACELDVLSRHLRLAKSRGPFLDLTPARDDLAAQDDFADYADPRTCSWRELAAPLAAVALLVCALVFAGGFLISLL